MRKIKVLPTLDTIFETIADSGGEVCRECQLFDTWTEALPGAEADVLQVRGECRAGSPVDCPAVEQYVDSLRDELDKLTLERMKHRKGVRK